MNDTIYHTGVIERIDPDKVYVKIIQQSACAGCHAKAMCNASESKDRVVVIEGAYDSFLVNEEVEIQGKTSLGYLAVLYAFVIPLILLFAVIVTLLEINRREAESALIGLAVLPVYYSFLYLFRDKLKKKFVFTMKKLK